MKNAKNRLFSNKMTLVSKSLNRPFNRIALVGSPASGKSTLAEALGEIINLPVFYLDLLVWQPNWTLTKAEDFNLAHTNLLTQKQWIIEGNTYTNQTIERFTQAEQIIFLDAPLEVCLERANQRTEEDKAIPNRFLPENCRFEEIHEQHLAFIKDFYETIRPTILDLLSQKFASKPQLKLDGRLPTEDLCSQIMIDYQGHMDR